jgi:hypothetical protein
LADGGLEIVSSFNRCRTSSRSDRDSPLVCVEQSVLSILPSNHAQEHVMVRRLLGHLRGFVVELL